MTNIRQLGARGNFRRPRLPERPGFALPFDSQPSELVKLYQMLTPEKQREFWQVTGSPFDKVTFLLRWGTYGDFEGRRA